MKSFTRVFLLFAAACFAVSAASFVSSLLSVPGEPEPAACTSYVLKSTGEEICIYADAACTDCLGTLRIRPDELPEADRRLLESGVLVESEQQLLSLLEDYTG